MARPDGRAILEAQFSAEHYSTALVWAAAALKDKAIALPLPERCGPLLDKPLTFWDGESAMGALRTCMPARPEPQPTPAPNPT